MRAGQFIFTDHYSPSSTLCSLPARFHDARNLALQRKLAEADATQFEFPQIAARSPAALAARVSSCREFRLPVRFCNQRFFRHKFMNQSRRLVFNCPTADRCSIV
jgi:hypothetical protein